MVVDYTTNGDNQVKYFGESFSSKPNDGSEVPEGARESFLYPMLKRPLAFSPFSPKKNISFVALLD